MNFFLAMKVQEESPQSGQSEKNKTNEINETNETNKTLKKERFLVIRVVDLLFDKEEVYRKKKKLLIKNQLIENQLMENKNLKILKIGKEGIIQVLKKEISLLSEKESEDDFLLKKFLEVFLKLIEIKIIKKNQLKKIKKNLKKILDEEDEKKGEENYLKEIALFFFVLKKIIEDSFKKENFNGNFQN